MAPPPIKRSVNTLLKKPPDKVINHKSKVTKGAPKILSKSVASGSTITPSDSADLSIRSKLQDVISKAPPPRLTKEDPLPGKAVDTILQSIFDNPEMMTSSVESDASGIISDSDCGNDLDNDNQTQKYVKSKNNAKINLDQLDTLPDNINQIIIASSDIGNKLTTYNPQKIRAGIELICGEVKNAEYLRSGSILVTIKTKEQIAQIKNCQIFPVLDIPIVNKIAWTHQFTYGKLWAPELKRDTVNEILKMFEEQGVIAVRKFFSDPNREQTPLYVLTFLGPAPKELKLGYQIFPLDKYLPSPLTCKNCYRFGHTTKICRGKSICKICSSPEHKEDECDQKTSPKCINCKGSHAADDKQCPTYILEKEICTLTADKGISFAEARSLKRRQNANKQPSQVIQETQSQNTIRNGSNSPPHPYREALISNLSSSNLEPSQQMPSQATQEISTNPPSLSCRPKQYPHQASNIDNTQSSSYIRPGQISNRNDYNYNRSPQYTPLPLPSVSPPYGSTFENNQNNNSLFHERYIQSLNFSSQPSLNNNSQQHQDESQASNTEQITPPNMISNQETHTILNKIVQSLPKIIPLIIKILFATTVTERIECITNIGQLLDISNIITNSLSTMHINNYNNSTSCSGTN